MDETQPDDDSPGQEFAALGLRAELITVLTALGYEEPTPIQTEAIPPLIEGRDLLGQAATGTGKTAAFALPILERLAELDRSNAPRALILVPTRELAMQVSEAVHKYGRGIGARVVPVFGGQPIDRQLRALRSGCDVVVATPGRAIDHIARKTLVLDEVRVVVLDEADEMLDMGFAEDLESILESTPADRQTVLFSATMPSRINGIASRHLNDPVRIEIKRSTASSDEGAQVRQTAYMVSRSHKPAALGRILDVESPTAAIVFCRTRNEVDELTETLNGRGYRAEPLHGGMSQEQRDRVMNRVRNGTAELLVATDVAARGLDIDVLSHVVNYDVPSAPESYVHRIGRVGRAGRDGVAITLAEPREHRLIKNIEHSTGRRISIEKVPSVADLQARRMELTQSALRDLILEGGLEPFRVVVESLGDEFDLVEVAMAAVRLAHEASGASADDTEIPDVAVRPERKKPAGKGASDGSGRPDRGASAKDERQQRPPSEGMGRVFVGAGRAAGVRPQDLVGAVAGETSLSGREIGAIQIADRFALVEVPIDRVDEVVWALRKTLVRGKKVTVRKDKGPTPRP